MPLPNHQVHKLFIDGVTSYFGRLFAGTGITFDVVKTGERCDVTLNASGGTNAPVAMDPLSTMLLGGPGYYEVDPRRPNVLRLTPLRTPLVDNADIKTNPPAGMTVANPTASGTCSISGGAVSLVANVAAAKAWDAATQTATAFYKTFTTLWKGSRARCVVARASCPTATVTHRLLVIFARKNGATTPIARIGVGFNIAVPCVYSDGGGLLATNTTITSGQRDTGVWIRLFLSDTDVSVEYNVSSSDTMPTSGWVSNGTSAASYTSGDSIDVGFALVHGTDTATAFTARLLAYDDRGFSRTTGTEREGFDTYAANNCVAFGYATSPGAVSLKANAKFSTAALPDMTLLRARLADAINKYGDAGAWTFSLTGADTDNPAVATTFQTYDALIAKEAGSDTAASSGGHTRWNLSAKCTTSGGTGTGTGTVGGTLDVNLITLEAA